MNPRAPTGPANQSPSPTGAPGEEVAEATETADCREFVVAMRPALPPTAVPLTDDAQLAEVL
jgi:hypothetical protein